MNYWMTRIAICAVILVVTPAADLGRGAAQAATPPAASATKESDRPAIGDRIDQLRFHDTRFLERRLDDFFASDQPVAKRAIVLVFTNTTCPLVRKYLPRLRSLDEKYSGQGVQFVAVNVGPADSILDVATQAVQYDMPFPFVKDIDGACTKACGVQRTPEAVVLDADRRLRYRGRIDDQYRIGGTAPAAAHGELEDALAAVLEGREPLVAETAVDGCLITAPQPPAPAKELTYHEHVAPLISKHCSQCHQPGTAAPFSLLTYDDAAANLEMIAETVETQRMPPWYASPDFGHFTNCRTIPREERETIVAWARAGGAEGARPPGATASDAAPANVVAADGSAVWQMGEPDLVITMPRVYDIPADGYVDYEYAVLPRLFLRDVWVQGLEILPDNPNVVHHCNLGMRQAGEAGVRGRLVTGYVPGGGPMQLAHGVAAKLPAGSILSLQIHFTTTGKPEKCRLRVGLRFPRDRVQKELRHLELDYHKIAIPPYAPHYAVSRRMTVDEDVTLYGFFAHMHVRGKDAVFRATPPGGDAQTLLMIPNYHFDWQLPYYVAYGDVKFPAGSDFECVAHFDNSTFNPFNPDPSATVYEGEQTIQEMMYGFVFYTEDQEELNLEVDPTTGFAKD